MVAITAEIEELVGKKTQLLFECAICKKIYKEPGMCQQCDLLLKIKGG